MLKVINLTVILIHLSDQYKMNSYYFLQFNLCLNSKNYWRQYQNFFWFCI